MKLGPRRWIAHSVRDDISNSTAYWTNKAIECHESPLDLGFCGLDDLADSSSKGYLQCLDEGLNVLILHERDIAIRQGYIRHKTELP